MVPFSSHGSAPLPARSTRVRGPAKTHLCARVRWTHSRRFVAQHPSPFCARRCFLICFQKSANFFVRTFHPVIFDRMKSNSKVIHFSIEKSIEKCTERYIEKCTEKYIEKSRFIGEVYWVYQVRMGRVLIMLKSFTRAKSLRVEHVEELYTR